MKTSVRRGNLLRSSALAALLISGVAGSANAADPTYLFNVPAESLSQALTDFSQTSSQQIIFTEDLVRGRKSGGLHGTFTVEQALTALLAGTDLRVQVNAGGVLMVQPKNAQAASSEAAPLKGEIETVVVTGTHIRGVQPSSPLTTMTEGDIRNAGLTDLGQAVRSLPQDFSGGQNPAVIGAPGGPANQNSTGASTPNLRGLGPDATLTLLNGRRLTYDGFTQAIDISTIPLAAISSVQVMTDGASAIYGSDAVGGVVNVVLKKDYDGLSTSARYGGATDGGDEQEEFSVVGGRTWEGGGFVATYDYGHDTPIYSTQRDYASNLLAPYTLLGYNQHNSGVFSVHQDITDSIHLNVDTLYTQRKNTTDSNIGTEVFHSTADDRQIVISPTVSVDLPGSWEAQANFLYGRDNDHGNTITSAPGGPVISILSNCYCNTATAAEVDADGPIFALPAGDADLAIGAGYRLDKLVEAAAAGPSGEHKSYFGFAELNVPIVSPRQDIPGIHELLLNIAGRYESYEGQLGSNFSPKIGLLYAPNEDIDVKFSWGQSFKTPTLVQELQASDDFLFSAASFGGPGTKTAMLLFGGNPTLKPETADTFNLGAVWHPALIEGLSVEVNAFHIDYRNRVLQPVTNLTTSLSDPQFAQFDMFSPTPTQQSQAIAETGSFFNFSGGAYDPSNVFAIVDDRYTNIAHETVNGLDLSIKYNLTTRAQGSFNFEGAASWLDASERNGSLSPSIPAAGVIFTPPHFKGRAGVVWDFQSVTAAMYVNLIAGLKDTNATPTNQLDEQATVDLNILYRFDQWQYLHGWQVGLSIQNLFDEAPPVIAQPVTVNPRYDSTNFSPVGRFIGVTVTKDW